MWEPDPVVRFMMTFFFPDKQSNLSQSVPKEGLSPASICTCFRGPRGILWPSSPLKSTVQACLLLFDFAVCWHTHSLESIV